MDILSLALVAVVFGALGLWLGFHLEHSKNEAERVAYAKLANALATVDSGAKRAETLAADMTAQFEEKFQSFAQAFPEKISEEVKAARDAAAQAAAQLQAEVAAHAQTQQAKAALETQVASVKAAVS